MFRHEENDTIDELLTDMVIEDVHLQVWQMRDIQMNLIIIALIHVIFYGRLQKETTHNYWQADIVHDISISMTSYWNVHAGSDKL